MAFLGITLGLITALSGAAADSGPTLSTLAAASNRPAECARLSPRSGARKSSVWRLARMPTLAAYCDKIGRADALLGSDPKAALEAAQSADTLLPERPSASVAMARAKLAAEDAKGALESFDRALALDKRALDEPKAMNDYARALVLSGKAADAASIYRQLVPRAELLPETARPLVYLQAAHALLAHAASGASTDRKTSSQANADFADASAYLAEARSKPTSRFSGDVLLSVSLVFERAGEPEKAAAALNEAGRAHAAVSDAGKAYLAAPTDALALDALAAEASASPRARDAWQKYLDSGAPAPWVAAARAHLGKRTSDTKKSKPDPVPPKRKKEGAR